MDLVIYLNFIQLMTILRDKKLYGELPYIPSRYEFKLKDDTRVKKQFETIKKLDDRSDISIIINCGDSWVG